MIKISIITVCYNARKTIEQTIYSVITQKYKNIEYIVIDGFSTDGTINIIKKYQNKITKWISEKDNGIYNAMNKGIDLATGEYIQFLNADDALVNDEIIEKIVYSIEKYNKPDVLSAPVYAIDEKNKLQGIFNNVKNVNEIKQGKIIPHQGIFMKTSVIKEYRFNEKNKIVSDFELILRCAIDEKTFCFVKYPVVFFSNDGLSGNSEKLRIKEHCQVLNRYLGKKTVEKFKKNGLYIDKLRYILKKSGILIYIRKYTRGWKKHTCNNKYCRWCNNKERI